MRPITDADVPKAAEVIADAFADDPFWAWLFPGAERSLVVRSWIRQLRIAYMPKGHSYVNEDVSGAALWSPPGKWRLSRTQELRLAPSYLRLLGPPACGRPLAPSPSSKADTRTSRTGTSPSSVSHPHTSAAASDDHSIEPMLERADARPASRVTRDVQSGQRRLLRDASASSVTKEDDVPGGGPHMWAMIREPA